MIDKLLEPPAVVREAEDQKSAQYWHKQAITAERKRAFGTLEQSEAWYYLKKTGGYRDLGYASIAEYVYKEFSKSAITTDKYIQIYKVFIVDLDKSMDSLIEVGVGKLSKIVAHVTAENVDELLAQIKHMTQQEITEKIKNQFSEVEASVDEKKTLRLKGPLDMIEVVENSLRIAKDEVCALSAFETWQDVPDLSAMIHICATYNGSVDLDGNPVNTLETAIANLESAFGVQIEWKEVSDE